MVALARPELTVTVTVTVNSPILLLYNTLYSRHSLSHGPVAIQHERIQSRYTVYSVYTIQHYTPTLW